MTELSELVDYFSSNVTGPEYVSRLQQLLELAGFEYNRTSNGSTFYRKENPASLQEQDGLYIIPEIIGDMADSPIYVAAEIKPDGGIEVLKVTFRMFYGGGHSSKTIKSDGPPLDVNREALEELELNGSVNIQTPFFTNQITKVPEIKGQEALQYILDLARQQQFSY